MEEILSQAPSSSATSSKRRRNDGLIYLGPKDKNFENYILLPSGVRIMQGIFRQRPEDILQDDDQQGSSFDSEIFLKLNDRMLARISSQITHWHQRMYDEGELVDFINKFLAPWEDWTDWNGDQGIISLRRRELKVSKGGPALRKQLKYI